MKTNNWMSMRFLLALVVCALGISASLVSAATLLQTNVTAQSVEEDFDEFLTKFTSSADFQFSRIKFPLPTPIAVYSEDGEEIVAPFIKDKWLLLSSERFEVGAIDLDDEGLYEANYVVNNPTHKEFEAGMKESELDLRVVFDLIDGKWFVTDATMWYDFELVPPGKELRSLVQQVKELNEEFAAEMP